MRRVITEKRHKEKLEHIIQLHTGFRGGRFKNVRAKNVSFSDDHPGEWPLKPIKRKHSFYKNTSHAKNLKRYAKRFANRTVRKTDDDIPNGNFYKRLWNYWMKYDA